MVADKGDQDLKSIKGSGKGLENCNSSPSSLFKLLLRFFMKLLLRLLFFCFNISPYTFEICEQGKDNLVSNIGKVNMAKKNNNRRDAWIFDSGATDTMTYDPADIKKASEKQKNNIETASGELISVKGGGIIDISPTLKLSNCLYIPSLSHKLLSISHMTKELNCSVLMHPTFCIVQDIRTGTIIGRGTERQGLYYVDEVTPEGTVMLAHGSIDRDAWLWHRRLGHPSAELDCLLRPCERAFRLYTKTKEKPSRESVKRAKNLPREGLHPMFMKVLGDNELSALAFSESLKAYRAKQTVLESEGHAAKAKHLQGPASQWVDVMKMKRAIHEGVINKVNQQHSSNLLAKEVESTDNTSTGTGKKVSGSKRKARSFKDEEFFISSVPTNQHFEAGLSVRNNQGGFASNRLDSAVLDLAADDSGGLQKQKSSYHWDKRSKKYVKLNNGDRVTASGKIVTESGSKAKANKTGLYKRWKERSHSKISFQGPNNEGGSTIESTILQGGRKMQRGFRGGNKSRLVPNAHVRSEVKNLEQVRKERQTKATKAALMKNNPKKGKKFGKNASKRGKGRK